MPEVIKKSLLLFVLLLPACGGDSVPGGAGETETETETTETGQNTVSLYSYTFDSAADQADPEGSGGSAEIYASRGKTTTTYHAGGAWDGGSFLRVQLVDNGMENDAGLFIWLDHLDITGQMNIGWIARFGDSFIELTETNKMVMFRVGDGTNVVHNESPQMIVSTAHTPTAYHVPQISTNPANGGRQDEFGRTYPTDHSDNHSFRFEDHTDEWLYYEIQNDTVSATVTLTIYDRTGAIASVDLCSTASDTQASRELYAFRFAAYLWPVTGTDVNSYADISDIYVNDAYIGPPPGFVN